MANNYMQYLLHTEVKLTTIFQEIFEPVDSWLVSLSEFVTPASLVDYMIPILGIIDMHLMGEMAFVLGLLNVMASVIKWIFPQYLPYWWFREYYNKAIHLSRSPLSCDTSGGFPSAHSMTFTGFMYMLLLIPKLSPRTRYLVVTLLSIPMWISRVYFGSHFLHQCICGSFMAVFVIETIRRKRPDVIFIESWRKTIAIAAVVTIGLFVIGMYFVMLYVGLDPHWSVRMAFKWCTDMLHLRPETSPIFILCRDLGFMMGIALSTPLSNRLKQRFTPTKSIPAVVVIIAVNFLIRSQTPKNYGRFAFVGYEFVRNAMHSFTLLTIVPKLCLNKKQIIK